MRSFILLLIFITSFIYHIHAQSQKELQTVSLQLKDMKLVPAGSALWRGLGGDEFLFTAADSNLLVPFDPGEKTINNTSSFYLSNHEVTNDEYGKFISWVRDSLLKAHSVNQSGMVMYRYIDQYKKSVDIDILPDSQQWIRRPGHSTDMLRDVYHNNKELANNPVVNISQMQAQAYIHWLNDRFAEILRANHILITNWGSYRLPEVAEWEYAVYYSSNWLDENQTENKTYAWPGKLLDGKNAYRGNFGWIVDRNGVYIKEFCDDGYCYPAPVKSYEPNELGLYDMSGNVSEWMNTNITLDSVKQSYRAYYEKILSDKYAFLLEELCEENPDWTLFEKQVEKSESQYNSISDERDMATILLFIKYIKNYENQNLKVLKRIPEAVIVKSGSWADDPCYLMNASLQAYSKTNQNAETGFRIALTLNPELQKVLEKYMLKK